MPAVNNVGEPCAGEPHARFDGRGAGNGTHNVSPRQPPTLHEAGDDEGSTPEHVLDTDRGLYLGDPTAWT